MNYFKQVLTVTTWEYQRFFKIKNELLGIVVMLVMGGVGYYVGGYAVSAARHTATTPLAVSDGLEQELKDRLSEFYELQPLDEAGRQGFLDEMAQTQSGTFLEKKNDVFVLHAYKSSKSQNKLKSVLDDWAKEKAMSEKGIDQDVLSAIYAPADLEESYIYVPQRAGRSVLAYFFGGLTVMAVFISFAYQFTGITGEKQLKITEQIVSAIKPQVWMDGKILGITLTGLSSMVTYSVLSILGISLFFAFTGTPVSAIMPYLHLPSILLFFAFSIMGILMWNALLAAIASIITDPNNSGKSSVMLLPALFVIASFLIMIDPDNNLSLFLAWFPLTSATAMPMLWVVTEIPWWHVPLSFALLCATFYFLRVLAAKIFRFSILINGKEPDWMDVIKVLKE